MHQRETQAFHHSPMNFPPVWDRLTNQLKDFSGCRCAAVDRSAYFAH